jgi:hypothetical protein
MEMPEVNQKYTKQEKTKAFFLMVLFSGIPWWVTDYNTYQKKPIYTTVSFLIIAICAGYIKATSKHRKREILLAALGAHQIALIIKMVFDGLGDPTNHNLAPFEMLMILVADFVVCLISIYMVVLAQFLTKKK